jgi:hypothetical protein
MACAKTTHGQKLSGEPGNFWKFMRLVFFKRKDGWGSFSTQAFRITKKFWGLEMALK